VPSFTIAEAAMLLASDSRALNTGLGYAVDISRDGRTIVAGSGPGAGEPVGQTAAYFFAKPTAGWSTATESAKVVPSDALQEDWFRNRGDAQWRRQRGRGRCVRQGSGREPDAGRRLRLYGNATAPKAVVAPSSLSFAPQSIATTSTPKNRHRDEHRYCSVARHQRQCDRSVHNDTALRVGVSHCTRRKLLGKRGLRAQLPRTQRWNPQLRRRQQRHHRRCAGRVTPGRGHTVSTTTRIESITAARLLVNQLVAVFFEVRAQAGSTYTPAGPVVFRRARVKAAARASMWVIAHWRSQPPGTARSRRRSPATTR
jgi:hypothetical protein